MSLHQLITACLKVSPDRIGEETDMKDVPEWDSLKHMEMIVMLEQHYAVELTGDEIATMTSVKAIQDVLRQRGK